MKRSCHTGDQIRQTANRVPAPRRFPACLFYTLLVVILSCISAIAGLKIIEYTPRGSIDYEQGVVRAVGKGFAPSNAMNDEHGKELARIAAKADAHKNLAELVNGVRVKGTTTVMNMVASATVEETVSAMIRQAVVVKGSDKWDSTNKMYELTLEMPMDAIGEALLGAETATLPSSEFTGLVVGATGLNLTPSLSVILFDEAFQELLHLIRPAYRAVKTAKVNGPPAPETGTYTVADAKKEVKVVGDKPLVVRAARTKGDDAIFLVFAAKEAEQLRAFAKSCDKRLYKRAIIITD